MFPFTLILLSLLLPKPSVATVESIEIVDQKKSQPYVYIQYKCRGDRVITEYEILGDELWNFAVDNYLKPITPKFGRFSVIPSDMKGMWDYTVGFKISSNKTIPHKRYQFSTMPAGKYIKIVYHGPYEGLSVSHKLAEEFAKANNLSVDYRSYDFGEYDSRRHKKLTTISMFHVEELPPRK